MEFTIKGPSKDNVYNLMREIGYFFEGKEETTGELAFARPLRSYPRFHIFLTIKGDNLIFDLHLDQKRTSYPGTTPHSGEYGGKVVEKEAKRIKQTLKK